MSRLLPPKVTTQIREQNKRLELEKIVFIVVVAAIWHFADWTYGLGALGLAIWYALADLRRESNLNSMLLQYQIGMLDYLDQ